MNPFFSRRPRILPGKWTHKRTGQARTLRAIEQLEDRNLLAAGALDFGDAPNPYPTRLEQDGARHMQTALFLGGVVDIEANGQPNANSDGDDAAIGDIVTGTSSFISHAKAFNGVDNAELRSFFPYGGFTGGVRVATGDVNGDGFADIITGSGLGATHVKVQSGANDALLSSFFAFPGFNGGVHVAAGDVNNDGHADIIAGADAGAPGGHVRVFSGANGAEISSFFAYPGFFGGARVAAGDVNGDGFADIITGSGPGGTHVKVFSGATGAEINSFLAFEGSPAGVFVGAGDVNGDGRTDIITGVESGDSLVRVFSGANNSLLHSFIAYPELQVGVRVGATDLNGDGRDDIITGPSTGNDEVKVFNGVGGNELRRFHAFNGFAGGVFVAGGNIQRRDDEDGLHIPLLNAGHSADLSLTASQAGRVDAWIDFNDDGDWSDAGEHILANHQVQAGRNSIQIDVPESALDGDTYARFRISSAGGLGFTGQAMDGEVEDYRVIIDSLNVNTPPDVLPLSGVTVGHTQQATVTLAATDAENDPVVFSALAASAEFALNQQFEFFFSQSFYQNFLGRNEKWFRSATEDDHWFFVEPDGEVFRWLGGNHAELVGRVNPGTHADPHLLFDSAPGFDQVALTLNGNQLQIDPDNSFTGTFAVIVTGSDGRATDSEILFVEVTNTALDLDRPSDLTLSPGTPTAVVQLHANDPDPNETLTYSGFASSREFQLDQQFDFFFDHSDFHNFLGRNERWFRAANDHDRWYFIEPDGEVYRWLGGSDTELVGTVSAAAHANLNLLTDAQPGVAGVTVTVNPNTGRLDLNTGSFQGQFAIIASVTDGNATDTETFIVSVRNSAPNLQPIADQNLATNENQRVLTLNAPDPDAGDTVTFSAVTRSLEFVLDQEFDFFAGASDFHDFLFREERWFRSAKDHNRWYFIEPDGEIYRWLGGSHAELVDTVSPAAHTDLDLLTDPTAQMATGLAVSINNTNRLVIDPDQTFTGRAAVEVTATDNHGNADTELFRVTVSANPAPMLPELADLEMNRLQTADVTIDATDAQNQPLTFEIHGESLAFVLDQELGLFSTGNDFRNYLDRDERWFRAANDSNNWYFIEPDGEVYLWHGGTEATLVANLPAFYHAQLTELTNAQPRTLTGLFDAVTQVGANVTQVRFNPSNALEDLLVIYVSVSDGATTVRENFLLNVVASATVTVQPGNDRTDAIDNLLARLDPNSLIELLSGPVI